MLTGMNYVYEVYKAGSFSKAAKNLFISQPALSTAVSKVEKSLGNQIFNRSTTPLTLTETGSAYIEAVEKIMEAEYELQNRLLEINDMNYGHLNVGGASFFSQCMLPPIIKIFSETYPGITLEMTESDSIALYEDIQKKHIDLVLDAGICDDSQFTSHLLLTELILLAIPTSNPINEKYQEYQLTYSDILNGNHLPKQKCISLKELENEKFILLNKGHDMHNRSIRIFENNNMTPADVLYLNQLLTAYNFSAQGIGLAFVTDTVIKLASHQDKLLYYKINDDLAHRNIFLAHRNSNTPTKAMNKFIEIARKVYTQ